MKRPLIIALAVVAAGGLALAAALARPGWLPAWARIRGAEPPAASAKDEAGLYCKEHGVPEKFCTLCHEELTKTLLLCKEHGNVPEDICTKCHPEVEAKYKIEMCPKGHGLPKHFCQECGKAPSASTTRPDDGWCAAHNQPEAECPACPDGARERSPE